MGGARVASSQPERYAGEVWVGVNGWGSVKLGKGVLEHRTFRCTNANCPAVNYLTRGARAVVTETPHDGWRFSHWRGACHSRKPRCVIDVARVRPNTYGLRNMHVTATFVPVAPGITRDHPIPLGASADIGHGWSVRVDSVTPNVQLSPPPPAGAQYFDASVAISYHGAGSATPEQEIRWQLMAGRHTTYSTGSNPCPYPGPQPTLPMFDPLYSGQSVSGYVCWQVASSDAADLELYFGSGSLDYPGTTWFALH